jgi:hypothetical protein
MTFTPKFLYDDAATEKGGGTTEFKPKTQEQADFINNLRKQAGEEPIVFVAENVDSKIDNVSIDNKVGAKIENKKLDIDSPVDNVLKGLGLVAVDKTDEVIKIGGVKVEAKKEDVEINTLTEDEIEEKLVLKRLSAKAGREITSIDDFLSPPKEETADEKLAKQAERESAKLTFGLQNKKVTNKDVESFIADTKNPKEVAYNYFVSIQKEIDPTLTDKEIKESFESTYSINEDEDSSAYKLGQKQLNFIANNLIKERHKGYLGLESEYTSYEKSEAEKANKRKDILAKTPAYEATVRKAAQSITKLEVPFMGKVYTLELDKELTDVYVNQMLTPEYAERMITNGNGADENLIQSTIHAAVMSDNFGLFMKGIGDKILKDNEKGLRGIVPSTEKRPAGNTAFATKQAEAEAELTKRLTTQGQLN